MFFVLPLGPKDAAVRRLPWVSIALAATCVLAFIPTWVLPDSPEGPSKSEIQEVLGAWRDHAYLNLDPGFQERYLSERGRATIALLHAKGAKQVTPAEEATRADDQARLDEQVASLMARGERSLLRRYSLVPARGLAQPGWITNLFLHFGWTHLLFNLFFFYLVGPMLEDVWGRPLFLAFYLVGGVVASLAQFALAPHAGVMIAGASGAIAACIGAFAVRYAERLVRIAWAIFFGFRLRRGVVEVPGWTWGMFWFGGEVLSWLLERSTTGVAVMAHIGGFLFGFAVAIGVKLTGLETRVVAPALDKKAGWVQHPGLEEAATQLSYGNHDAAQRIYAQVLSEAPDNVYAQLGLARLEMAAGAPDATPRVERLLLQLASNESPGLLRHIVEELGPGLGKLPLRPPLANRVALALQGDPEAAPLLEPLFALAGGGEGLMAAKALVHAAELRLAGGSDPEPAAGYLERAAGMRDLPPAVAARIQELQAKAQAALASQAPTRRPRGGFITPPPTEVPLGQRIRQAVADGQGPLALDLYRSAGGKAPDLKPRDHFDVGRLAAGQGDFPLAAEALKRAAADPSDALTPQALVVLGRVLAERLNDGAAAERIFRLVIERYPDSEGARFARQRVAAR